MAVERRQSPWWVPLVAIGISAVSMILGPCFGAGVAVLGNYVTNANRSVLAEAQQKQLAEDMKGIRESLQKLVDQNVARVATDATTASEIVHVKADLATETVERKREADKLRSDVDDNAKLITAYANKGKK